MKLSTTDSTLQFCDEAEFTACPSSLFRSQSVNIYGSPQRTATFLVDNERANVEAIVKDVIAVAGLIDML